MKPRIKLVPSQCKHCGRHVMTASRSLLGLDQLKAEFGTVCSDCVTPEDEMGLARRVIGALREA